MSNGNTPTQFCSVTGGPNGAIIVVSFTFTELLESLEKIVACTRQSIRHATNVSGYDRVTVTVLIPHEVQPHLSYYTGVRTKMAHLRFEFPKTVLAFKCATTSRDPTILDRMRWQLLCVALSVTWLGSIQDAADY